MEQRISELCSRWQQVKKAAGIEGDLNVLLRKPHGRALSIVAKFNRMFGVKAYRQRQGQ